MQLGCASRVELWIPGNSAMHTLINRRTGPRTSELLSSWVIYRGLSASETTHTSGHVGKYFQRLLMLTINFRYTCENDWNDSRTNCFRECNKDVQMKLYYNVTGQSWRCYKATRHNPTITYTRSQDGGHLMLQSTKFTELKKCAHIQYEY